LQTILGSGQLLLKTGKSPGELRRAVTSKGGTTEAAIKTLAEGGFDRLVGEAVKAAHRRARALGKRA
jgi:pyrroline-5-carboxylate reductase